MVPPDDRDGLERLTRYLSRQPVSLERLQVDEHAQAFADTARIKPGLEPRSVPAPLDPKDFLARLVMHMPDPRRHFFRYYVAYSSVLKARRRQEATTAATVPAAAAAGPVADPPTGPEWRAARRRWAALIAASSRSIP